jgi:hypothetical protein
MIAAAPGTIDPSAPHQGGGNHEEQKKTLHGS